MNLIGPLFIDHKLPPFDPLAHFCQSPLLGKFEFPAKQVEGHPSTSLYWFVLSKHTSDVYGNAPPFHLIAGGKLLYMPVCT